MCCGNCIDRRLCVWAVLDDALAFEPNMINEIKGFEVCNCLLNRYSTETAVDREDRADAAARIGAKLHMDQFFNLHRAVGVSAADPELVAHPLGPVLTLQPCGKVFDQLFGPNADPKLLVERLRRFFRTSQHYPGVGGRAGINQRIIHRPHREQVALLEGFHAETAGGGTARAAFGCAVLTEASSQRIGRQHLTRSLRFELMRFPKCVDWPTFHGSSISGLSLDFSSASSG